MKLEHVIKKMVIAYCIYAFTVGIAVFTFHSSIGFKFIDNIDIRRFIGDDIGKDRVALIEDRYYSGIGRINLIDSAQETLDIAYYTVHQGITSNIFFGKILQAADRGVKVRVLIDGIFHNLRGSSKDIQYALIVHPNVELKFYEPLSLLKPWTWNNRLHDKYIIADNTLAMIGGRNIGDKYFLTDYNGQVVHDRDVVIINTNTNNTETTNSNNNINENYYSVINDIKKYYNMVWEHKFSQIPIKSIRNYQSKKGKEKQNNLKKITDKLCYNNESLNHIINWYEISVPTNRITLIHNPIMRFNKEPWVLSSILKLMEYSDKSIFIQSPYVIPTKYMLKYASLENILSKQISILTNSTASSPNYFAMGGYINNRKRIADSTDYLYEYHGNGSIHAKSYIIDNQISLIGTFNLDARSSFLNTESMVIIDSKEFAEILNHEINNLTKKSLLVGEDYAYCENPFIEERKVPFTKKIIIRVLGTFAYFFNFLL